MNLPEKKAAKRTKAMAMVSSIPGKASILMVSVEDESDESPAILRNIFLRSPELLQSFCEFSDGFSAIKAASIRIPITQTGRVPVCRAKRTKKTRPEMAKVSLSGLDLSDR